MSFTSGDFRRHWLEKRLSKKMGKAWLKSLPVLVDSVMLNLEAFDLSSNLSTNLLSYDWGIFSDKVTTDVKKIMDDFFKNIIKLGLREGLENPRAKFSDGEVIQQFNDFMRQSRAPLWATNLLTAYQEDFQNLINSLSSRLVIEPSFSEEVTKTDIKSYLVERAIARFNRYYSAISVEMQAAINSARESKYRERDHAKLFRYRWGIRTDDRTTLQCLEIDKRVKQRMRETKEVGVDIDWLKALINQVAIEIDPSWHVRDWTPHYNCRSVLKRVVV